MYTLVAYYFGIYDEVEKPVGDESQELPARNFERVEAGEAYAKSKEGFLADGSFVPVLLSQSGHDGRFGYGARTIGESVEDAREAWLDEGE